MSESVDPVGQQPTDADSPELQARLQTPYDVRVREKGGRFSVSIAELGLLEHGKSLEDAYARLQQARERRIREYGAEGLLAWLPRAEAPAAAEQPSLLRRLWPFFIKAAVVGAMLVWGMGMLNDSTRNIGYGLEKKLDSLANWSKEDMETNRGRAAKIAEKLGPIVRELLVMFREPAPAAEPAAPPTAGAQGGADGATQKAQARDKGGAPAQ